MIKMCESCGVEKDINNKELYPFFDDGIIQGEPVSPVFDLPCQPTNDEGDFRVVTVCHECFHKLSPDMWISQRCWEQLNPIVPFDNLKLEKNRKEFLEA